MELQLQQLTSIFQKLPHAKLSRLVVVLTVVYIAYLSAQLVWLFWPQPQSANLPQLSSSINSKTNSVNTQAIIQQNLFGVANAKPKEPVKPVSRVSDAPKTTLNVKLTGIVAVSLNDTAGLAIIESQGRQETYEVKDVITGTRAKLAQVLPDRVLLDVSGRFETLMLDGLEYTKQVAMPVSGPREAGPSPKKADIDRAELAQRRKELLKEPGKLLDYIRISQAKRNGELIGYRLSPGKDPELFKKMGLKNNDLAIAINGYQLTDMRQAMTAMQELREATDATISIERDGRVIDVQFSL
ncbi:type II secretion system protein GspC [Pseudoalteromonas phenolica]|uniref:Type II secretion system protein GspC n=1 Tax=Pseudoalteromonas phenolica TaxID=161398 RepID=A0A5S3YSS0_9GAMM|nr:type II secretion system protein GspC [Pseudoalteromonas phenolica]TMP80423.1 type II secretion system protein GspC [Pseudoalteromonas phenolica]